jgi:hypothetical protein
MSHAPLHPQLRVLIDELKKNAAVDLIGPEDPRYGESRLVYNRMHDRFPGVIVRTLEPGALQSIIGFAANHKVKVAIRGGGHHIGGFSTCNGGIVIDFSPFRKVVVDPERKLASVQPGTRLSDFDLALSSHGLVVPTGTVSDTGLAGLTLGGGIGWLVGKYGLACDHLCGADVLLADGRIVQAEAPEHRDLLWALRGGGGNFGVVLEFRYRLNPLPQVICGSGLVKWPDVPAVLASLMEYLTRECPESMSVAPVLFRNAAGARYLRIDFCYSGELPGEVDQLTRLSSAVEWRDLRPWQFKDWQKSFDQAFLPPLRGYWKAGYLQEIAPAALARLVGSFDKAPSPACSILIEHLHGAFKRSGADSSAFPLRNANFGILFSARWNDAEADRVHVEWAREGFSAIDPGGQSQAYSNYASEEDGRAIRSLMSASNAKISQVKSHYDPGNVFRVNHNIAPA